jgi:chemotaxis protein histidine kinase CheA
VTEVRKLKLEAAQRQQELYILQEIIQVPEDKFGRFLHKAREFLQENAHIIERDAKGVSQNCKRLFVNYHTLKGTARTYHLKTLSAQTHEAEHLLTEIMKGQTSWDRERLRSDLQRLEQCLESYYLTAKEKLHWNLDRETVTMKKEEMIDLLPLIQDIESDVCSSASRSKLQTLSVRILEHCYTRLNDIIQEAANGLDSIARDLLKEVPELTIRPNHHLLVDEWADKFHGVLAHILRNSLDHGLERPEVRRRAGKRSCGNIFIQVEQIDDYLMVAVHDDGRGLDLEKIQATATKRGLLSSQLTTDQEIAQLIFESGLSTKSQVDELSGRGVGMDAVKSYIEDGGGRVLLTLDENFIDRHHVPFRIELYLPASAWVRIQLSDAQPLAS